VRWFARGTLPAPLLTWFTAGGRFGVYEQRTDIYQLRPHATFGIKRRSGRTLEVKVLLSSGPEITLPGGVCGTCGEWRKWQPGNGANLVTQAVPWIGVQKTIVTRSFALPDNGVAVPVSEPDRRLPGCDVELASVTVGGTQAWTYAFEAFGPEEHRLAALRAAAGAVVHATPYPPGFWESFDCNGAYPTWLEALQNHEAVAAR
jgi:hypothetical protein